jgi:hypothetical protein
VPERDLVVHGHFYQPPRENPWTERVEREAGAAPFHDWNERIHAECYRANAFARLIQDGKDGGRIAGLVDNYGRLSFDLGPTLARWLEARHPSTLRRIVDGDRESAALLGHGNALAHPWVHLILPLADALDRATVLAWGLADFRHRFGREPEGLWLPETAADRATLAALVERGVRFTVLAPRQAARVRPPGGEWRDVGGGRVDAGRAYRWVAPGGSGRELAVFFYDGPLAQEVAFGDALASSAGFLERCAGAPGGGLVHLAVDGETFGHHRAWGDRVLAHALGRAAAARGFRLTNYGRHLAEHPPAWEVEIDLGPLGEGSSWSCAHGVGRWRRDCGCRLAEHGGAGGWNQAWRGPLRAALDLLRDRSRPFFAGAAGELLRDPWRARDAYVEVLIDRSAARRERFLAEHGWPELGGAEGERALGLLDLERHLLLMYSSCGWFFDDLAGVEGVLVLRRAARALDAWRELGGEPPEDDFLDVLAAARSNLAGEGSGADVFRLHARRGSPPPYQAPSPLPELRGAGLEHPGPREARTAQLLAALRRWLDGDAGERRERGRQVLDLLGRSDGEPPPFLERAQELYALRVARGDGHEVELAREIGERLGFATGFLERRLGPVGLVGSLLTEVDP